MFQDGKEGTMLHFSKILNTKYYDCGSVSETDTGLRF